MNVKCVKQALEGDSILMKGELKIQGGIFRSLFPFAGISLIRFKGYNLSPGKSNLYKDTPKACLLYTNIDD